MDPPLALPSRDTPRPDCLPHQPIKEATNSASPALQSISTGVPLGTWRSSATSSPSAEDMIISQDAATPFPQERSRLGQVLDLFRRRASSSSSRASHIPVQSLKEAREHAQKYISEIEVLQRRLEATECELASREAATLALEATNRHAQELLKRNTELEMMIANIQDESDILLREEKSAHNECRISLKLSQEKIDDMSSQILLLRSSKSLMIGSTNMIEELKDLKLSLTQHEIDLATVRSELDENRQYVEDLKNQLKVEKEKVHQLYEERKLQLNSLTNIGGELDLLLKENKSLDKLLYESRNELDNQIQKSQNKFKELFESSKIKDQKIAEYKFNLELKKNEINNLIINIEKLKSQNISLQSKTSEFENTQLKSTQLSAQLAQSEERRRLEQTYYEQNLQRIQNRLQSLEGVQKRATDLLSRNSELENIVSELRKKVTLLSQIPETKIVKQLKEQLQTKSTALTGAHETLRAQAADIKLLEKSLVDHRRRLQAAEITASRIEQPKHDGPESRAWQQAVEKVMTATRDDAMKEIDRIIREYDALVKSIREAHSKELEQRESDYQSRIRSSETDQIEEKLLQQRQRDLEKQLDQSRNEIKNLLLRKDQELEIYKIEFEKSFTRLQSRKIEEIRDQLSKKEEQYRSIQEELNNQKSQLKKDYENQIQLLKSDHSKSQFEKDQNIGRLEAELISLKLNMETREKEIQNDIQIEANKIAEKLVENYKKDFDSWIENQKREHEKEVSKIKNDFRIMIEDAKRENDKLRLENEMDVSNLRRDHEERMSNLRSTLNELVDQATNSLKSDLNALKDQLTTTQNDRNKISDENIRLGREVNKLRAGVDERDAELQRMIKHQKELEITNSENLKELQEIATSKSNNTHPIQVTSETYEAILSRNSELEEIVADVSEKYHEELKTRMENSELLTRIKLEYESDIRQLNIQIENLKSEKEGITSNDSASEILKTSLESRVNELTSKLVQLETEKQQMVADLEVEKTRVQSLRQQLNSQTESSEERRRIKSQLIQKIRDIEKLTATWEANQAVPDAQLTETASIEAEKKRLEAEVGSLKNLVLDRQKTIAHLETTLQERLSQTTNTDELAARIQKLQNERQSLVTETKMLEASLKRQEDTLQNEIKQRDIRLKKLTGLNDTLSTTLQRNSELEMTVQDLLKELHRSCSFITTENISEKSSVLIDLVEKFEDEFRTRSASHEEDLKVLNGQLDEREVEISRLQVELRNLKIELEANHQEQMTSQKVQFESRIQRLVDENMELVTKRNEMEADLKKIQGELTQAQQNGTERVNKMISDLTEKLKDHQLAIAEIQTERDQQTQQYETMLKVSQDVQAKLKAEIEKVSSELAGKETDIFELTKAIKEIMSKEGIEDAHLDAILDQANSDSENPLSGLTGERWTHLMGTLETLFVRLSKSQRSAKSLMSMLNALLKEQQESLHSIAESQAAAIQNHSLMSQAVSSDIVPSEKTTITVVRPSFPVHGGDLSLVGDGLATLRNELRVLKESRKSFLEPSSGVVRRMSPTSGGSTTARTSTVGTEIGDGGKGKKRFPETDDSEMKKRARLTP